MHRNIFMQCVLMRWKEASNHCTIYETINITYLSPFIQLLTLQITLRTLNWEKMRKLSGVESRRKIELTKNQNKTKQQ